MQRLKKILFSAGITYSILIMGLLFFHQYERVCLYGMAVFCALGLFFSVYAIWMFERSMRRLRDFVEHIGGEPLASNDEIDSAAKIILQNYEKLKENQHAADAEREKLLQHVHSAREGICFFAPDRNVEFCNGLFIQYLNILIDEPNAVPALVFSNDLFADVTDFLDNRKKDEWYFEKQITQQGREFALRINIFGGGGFEAIINDITRLHTARQVKQEITDNIIHELRTPVAGIRGCLETVLQRSLPPDREHYFVERACNQTIALSQLISDMTLLTKTSEAPQQFSVTAVDLVQLLETLRSDLEIPLMQKNITMLWQGCENLVLQGNITLIYAIFRNLTDNVIQYAGEGSAIQIQKCGEDSNFYYFSYADSGVGVPAEHLPHIFDRFYRIDVGRTREIGGSGLGLAIVKNAVTFHGGAISAKNQCGGGLEVIFTLRKH